MSVDDLDVRLLGDPRGRARLGSRRLTDDDGPGSVEAWDSLAHIRLIHALESRFDVRLPDSALLEQQTVASLKRLVAERAAG